MNSILLAGLTDHEAAALEIMIGMHWREQRTVTLARSLSLSMPEQTSAAKACGGCVIDLFGFGMRRHTAEHEARLLAFLAGRSAVLLVWGNGGGWLERKLPLARGQQLAWITMPYSSVQMREALKKLNAAHADEAARTVPTPALRPAVRREPPPPPPAAQAPARVPVPAWRRAMDLAEKLKSSAPSKGAVATATASTPTPVSARAVVPMHLRVPSAPAPAAIDALPAQRAGKTAGMGIRTSKAIESISLAPPVVPLAEHAVELDRGGLTAVLQVFPALLGQPLVDLVAKIMAHDGAQLLSVGGDAAFVTHASHGWLASSLPVPALLKMLRTPSMLQSVSVSPLIASQVEETMRQRFGGNFHRAQKPLDVLTWELVGDLLKRTPLKLQANLSLQLRRFPNFTLLADVGPMDVQLAAICARTPQSVADMARAFPRHEQDVYRFVVLCILSGLAVVTQLPAESTGKAESAGSRHPASGMPKAASSQQVAARRGFFKSLLDKLF